MEYKTILVQGKGEYEEKKSRFLGEVHPVSSESEIEEILKSIRKKYYDARHVCFAYRLGEKGDQERFSDDQEPSGTAGLPMLSFLQKEGLTNILCVVTRYFGGTLLGTGGLVRAYTEGAKAAVQDAVLLYKEQANYFSVTFSYNYLTPIQRYLSDKGLKIGETEYLEQVQMKVPVPFGKEEKFKADMENLTNGKVNIQLEKQVYFSEIDHQVKIFDN